MVNLADFNILAARFGTSLAPGAFERATIRDRTIDDLEALLEDELA